MVTVFWEWRYSKVRGHFTAQEPHGGREAGPAVSEATGE